MSDRLLPGQLIASQLEPFFNEALSKRLGQSVLALPPGVPTAVPGEVVALVAAPIDRSLPQPPGWPFGLQWIQLVTSGLDKHPSWLLNSLPTSTARGVAAETIAEYVAAAIFDASKSMSSLRVREPEQWKSRATSAIRGSTVGVVGLGAIGQAVATKMLGLGCRVLALRRSAQPSPVSGVELTGQLGELMAASDHLVLAAPATAQTHHLINDMAFAVARHGLHLINVARGELVDDAALLRALERGVVRRATLDVTKPEPLPAGHAFYSHPGVWLTPHSSALGQASRLALVDKVLANLERRHQGLMLLDQA